MKYIFCFILFTFFISACKSDQTEMPSEKDHYVLDDILYHLPFDHFNGKAKAIFRNLEGHLTVFSLSIKEDVIENSIEEKPYSANEIRFIYSIDFDFDIPNLEIIARTESLEDLGFKEIIICRIDNPISSFSGEKLRIIPDGNYKTTVLNEDFMWMGESFENVYSNVLIEENPIDNVKMYYQSSTGIIGFTDNTGVRWVFDRFE